MAATLNRQRASGSGAQGGGYVIGNSCRFNDGDSPELALTYTLNAPWTLSCWIKRCEITSLNNILGTDAEVHFNANDTLEAEGTSSTALFRDPSAWCHVHVSNNGLFFNGVSHGAVTTTNLSNAKLFDDFDGYVAEVHLKSGTDAVTNFAEDGINGNLVPIEATSGEHYLTFSDSSALGTNSGSGSDWTATNLAANDQTTDSPTDDADNDVGNYCTWNPLNPNANWVYSNGNLTADSSTGDRAAFGTLAMPGSGKYYFEITVGGAASCPGIVHEDVVHSADLIDATEAGGFASYGGGAEAYAYYGGNSGRLLDATSTAAYDGGAQVGTDVIGVAVDLDNGYIWFSLNDSWIDPAGAASSATVETDISAGNSTYAAFTGLSGNYFPMCHTFGGEPDSLNCGQLGFSSRMPTNFKHLHTGNLPAPAIPDSSAYFQSKLYTGNGTAIGSGGQAVVLGGNSTLKPDLVWVKDRDTTSQHAITDVTRGATKELVGEDSTVESTVAEGVSVFGTDGFTIGDDAAYNTSSSPQAAYCWNTQGGAGASNTDGSINTTTTSVGATQGFSISTYTGTGSAATIGHGLGVAPAFVMVKERANDAGSWFIYHQNTDATAPEDYYVLMDTTGARVDNATVWNDTAPTSSVFSIGTHDDVNASGDTYVAYCWAEVPGFCKIGQYTGNSAANGPFIYLGFQPAMFLVWETTTTHNFKLIDSKRVADYNPVTESFNVDSGAGEEAISGIDFLSNGFKIRIASNLPNNSEAYNYIAWAEHPFGGEGVSQARAR